MKKLSRSFYTRPTRTVAKELLGKIFVRKNGNRFLTGRIVETEAYLHNDPACHAYRGITERNKVMFNTGGFLYVYFTYGMHFCANVVTYKEGIGEAVLIRAVEPVDGIDAMTKNRNFKDDRHLKGVGHLRALTNGPAKFAQAFNLTKEQSGIDLLGDEIFITEYKGAAPFTVVSTTRIGIKVGIEKKWRYYIKGNEWISKK
ncbi:MAG: DNA-3-methyladenine glycosylase [Bacteroidota bacterium]|nr:DNA-3-methyladenine glycosylase [Bacteroidota bacterium]